MSPWLHRYILFTAFCTFLLLIAGALVTGNEAGLSVPDWPLSYGSLTPPMIGGIFYEHGHRMIASFVGLLTVILAFWVWKQEKRKLVRIVAFSALGTVIAQGVLGGLTVLLFLPAPISVMHACLAQTFFCLMATLVLMTSKSWQEKVELETEDRKHIPLRKIGVLTTAAIYVQLILGAALRHSKSSILFHIAGAFLVTFFILWFISRIYKFLEHRPELFNPALILGFLLMVQISLGVGSYLVRLTSRDDVQPLPLPVAVTTAHLAVGALLLATSVVLTIQVFRIMTPAAAPLNLARATQEAS
jgi:cytochrome c oxidase assembly protein subunit 15